MLPRVALVLVVGCGHGDSQTEQSTRAIVATPVGPALRDATNDLADATANQHSIAPAFRDAVEAALARDCDSTESDEFSGVPLDKRKRARTTRIGRTVHGPSGTDTRVASLVVTDGRVVLKRDGQPGFEDLTVDLATGKVTARPIAPAPACAPTPIVGLGVATRLCTTSTTVWAEDIGGRAFVVLATIKGAPKLLGVSCIDTPGLRADPDRWYWYDRHSVWERATDEAAQTLLFSGYQPGVAGRIADDLYISSRHRFGVVSLRDAPREMVLGTADVVAVGATSAAWLESEEAEDGIVYRIVLGVRLGGDRVVALREREPTAIAWLGARLLVLDSDDVSWRIDIIDP